MHSLAAAILTCMLTTSVFADDCFIDGGDGRTVRDTVAGLQWLEVDSRHLPNGVKVEIAHISGRNGGGAFQHSDFDIVFPSGARVSGGYGPAGAVIAGCFDADGEPNHGFFASFCRDWPEFRVATLVLMALGFEDITFTGESRNWPVDLNELDISRADILAYAETAAALNPSNEDN